MTKAGMDAHGASYSYTTLNVFLRLWRNNNELFRFIQPVHSAYYQPLLFTSCFHEIVWTYYGELLEGNTYTIEYGFSASEHEAHTNFNLGEDRIQALWLIRLDNLRPQIPSPPSGPTSGYTGTSYSYSTSTTDPDGDNIRYEFSWGDGTSKTTGWYASGATASAPHSWTSTGTYYVKVRAQDSLDAWSGWSPNLAVSISPPPPPGDGTGGCPFVYAWNGTQYVVDNNLLGDSEASSGADVEDYYRLEQSLVQKNGKYELLIREFEHEHSYLDQVKLMAVDHDSDVRVAVTQRGEILTYKNPHQAISATDNYGNNRLDLVSTTDNNYYQAYPDEYLTLDFGNLDITNGAKLVLRANVEKKPADPGACIHVQVLKEGGGWFEVEVLRTRQDWSTQIVDVRGHLPDANGELKIRLYFTGVHRIDYVGLDTTKQDDYQLQTANLISATHSVQGDVKPLLSEADNTYAELTPSEQIQLSFTLPNNSKQTRTYIFYAEGHYYAITP